MVNHYSCCIYVNNQAKFNANKLVSLWLSLIFKNGVILERKVMCAPL